MAYIGKQPVVGNFQKCDAISVVNGQAAYTLNVGGAAVNPENANHMLVSLNGVLQAPGDSFTVSGSTLTFASNLATGDVIDFVIILGDVLDLGAPSDGTVTAAKVANDLISGKTALASEPADTDEFLVSDAGVLKRIDYSLIKGGGGLVHLNTSTGSNVTSIDINGHFTSDYDHYKLVFSIYGATNNTDTVVRIMQSGSVITSSNYWYAGMGMYRAEGSTTANSAGANGVNLWRISSDDNTNNAQYPTTGEMLLSNPLSTTHNTTFTATNVGYNSAATPNAIRVCTFAGQYVDTSASSGVSFFYDGGNINGTIRLYGIKNTA